MATTCVAVSTYLAYLDEIEATIQFLKTALDLRAALPKAVHWDALGSSDRALLQRYFNSGVVAERIYQSVFVAIHAGFEQFLRDLVDEACAKISTQKLSHPSAEIRYKQLRLWHQKMSGIALSSVFQPIAYRQINYDDLVTSLASSATASPELNVYGKALSIRTGNLTCDEIESYLGRLGFQISWNDYGSDGALQRELGTINQKTKTTVALKKFIDDAVSTRNFLAHGQGAVPITYDELKSGIVVFKRFAELTGSNVIGHAS